MDKYKYINETTDMVGRCTREMVALMKEHNLNVVNFDNLIDAPAATFENEDDFRFEFGYYYERIKSISLDEDDNIIVAAENGLTGYLDGNYGDFFNVADKIGEIYRALVEKIEMEDKILTKEEKTKILGILNLSGDTRMMPIVAEENDDFVIIYLKFNGTVGDNMSVLRDKKTNELFIPTSDAYPMCIVNANTYVYHSLSDESETKTDIAFTDKFEKITMDKNLKDKLTYLNNCGVSDEEGIIFDGITFVWLKNHTLCVKSARRPNKSYIAVYKHRRDIVPSKFYEEKPLNFNFPENE